MTDYAAALNYLKGRFGDAKVSAELITTDTGYCTGCIFKVGRSKHVVGHEVRVDMLRLFADGIEYSERKRIEKKTRRAAMAA